MRRRPRPRCCRRINDEGRIYLTPDAPRRALAIRVQVGSLACTAADVGEIATTVARHLQRA
jgi:hypothetical protein